MSLAATARGAPRRLHRQILILEDDQLDAPARQQVSARISELEAGIAELQAAAEQARHQIQQAPPDHAEAVRALQRVPILAGQLADLPEAPCGASTTRSTWRSRTRRPTTPSTSASPTRTKPERVVLRLLTRGIGRHAPDLLGLVRRPRALT